MVVMEYNGYGYFSGHRFTFGWIRMDGANIKFDEYGEVTFNSSGYGENTKVKVQLGLEYGRYFCTIAVCHGFSNWISSNVEYFEVKPISGRVNISVYDKITGLPIPDMRVCFGLMCQKTDSSGNVYLGQFVFGTYSLTAAGNGYENYVETITLTNDLTKVIEMIPTGVVVPGSPCSSMPSYLQGLCKWVEGFVGVTITNLTNTIITPIQNMISKLGIDISIVVSEIVSLGAQIRDNAAAVSTAITGIYNDLYNTYSIITEEWQSALTSNMKTVSDRIFRLENLPHTVTTGIVISYFVYILEQFLDQEVRR